MPGKVTPGLLSDVLACLVDLLQRPLDRILHHGHAAPHGVLGDPQPFNDEDVDLPVRTLALLFCLAKDLLAPLPGLGEDPALGDKSIRPVTGNLDDPGALFLSLADDSLSFLDDPLRLLDLVGNGNTELIHQGEELFLFNHHARAERHTLANADQFFEPVNKVEDVCCAVLLGWRCAAICHQVPRGRGIVSVHDAVKYSHILSEALDSLLSGCLAMLRLSSTPPSPGRSAS